MLLLKGAKVLGVKTVLTDLQQAAVDKVHDPVTRGEVQSVLVVKCYIIHSSESFSVYLS